MKLNEIKGENSIELLADLIVPITNMALDDEVSKLFKRKKLEDGQTARTALLERVRDGMPALLKNHKDDLLEVVSKTQNIEKEKLMENLDMGALLKAVFELLADEAFTSLF